MGPPPHEKRHPSRRPAITEIFRQLFIHNALLKLVCLGLAFVIWYSVASLQPRDVTLYNVPVSVVNHRPDTSIAIVAYKVIDLRIRGRLKQLSSISPLSVPLVLDVTSLGPGVHSVWIDPSRIPLPPGVEVLRADPVSVPVTIERVASKTIPVEISSDASGLPADRILVDVEIIPRQLQVMGAESRLSSVRAFHGGTIRWMVERDQTTATHTLPVSIDGLDVSPREVTVRATIDRVAEVTLRNVPVQLPPRVAWASARSASVMISGAATWLQRLPRDELELISDNSSPGPGDHMVTLRLKIAEPWKRFIRSVRIEPAEVGIRLR